MERRTRQLLEVYHLAKDNATQADVKTTCVCVRASVCACERVCVCVCVRACVRACVYVSRQILRCLSSGLCKLSRQGPCSSFHSTGSIPLRFITDC